MYGKIKEQILTVRESGRTNMFDLTMVQRIAFEDNFHELVIFIEDHPKEYTNFILTGKFEGE